MKQISEETIKEIIKFLHQRRVSLVINLLKKLEDVKIEKPVETELTEEEKNERFKETALKISQEVEEKKVKEESRDEYAEEVARAEQLALEGEIDRQEMEEYEEELKRESADRMYGGND